MKVAFIGLGVMGYPWRAMCSALASRSVFLTGMLPVLSNGALSTGVIWRPRPQSCEEC